MERNIILEMLAMLESPAFAVLDGCIAAVNPAAAGLMISPDGPVEPLLSDGAGEYTQLREGVMSVTLQLGKVKHTAMVRAYPPYYIFRLEPAVQPEMNALALAAQQLRLPLSDLMAGMELLSSKVALPDDGSVDGYVGSINRSVYRLLRQVENMTDAGIYASGQTSKENCRVDTLVYEITEKADTLCRQSGKKVLYREPEAPIFALVDRTQLEKSLYGLLANALKFTPAGGTVQVELGAGSKLLHLSVEDQGGGIDEQVMVNLFTRYTRPPAPEDRRHGIGLGLFLVRSFAQNHDGSILLRNTAEGTRLTLSIPIRKGTARLRSAPLPNAHADLDRALIALSESLPADAYLMQ